MKVYSKAILLFLLILFFQIDVQAQDAATKVVAGDDPGLQWGPCPDFFPENCQIAVLHGDPTKKNADIFFKVPGNTKIPNHYHNSAERMILVSGEMEVAYEGEAPQILSAGSYAYGPAKKPHTAECLEGPRRLFIAFEEPVDAVAVENKN